MIFSIYVSILSDIYRANHVIIGEPEPLSDDDEVIIGEDSDICLSKNTISPNTSFKQKANLYINIDKLEKDS